MKWSPQQLEAIDQVSDWLAENEPHEFNQQIFRLFGYAGTGKTTLMRSLVEDLRGSILYAAYTGKAALVMQRHGIPASTVHSLIYQLQPIDSAKYKRLEKQLKTATKEELPAIRAEMKELEELRFQLNLDSLVADARLVCLDEVSMIYDEMVQDLLSFGVPLLVLGDPGQLPPIKGEGSLTEHIPDVMLTEVHRQAEGNPIIKLATMARMGETIPYGDFGESSVIPRRDWVKEDALDADQILVGKNKTRRRINTTMRRLKGYEGILPEEGERVICLRNDKEKGILNGLMADVLEIGDEAGFGFPAKIKTEEKVEIDLNMLTAYFQMYENEEALDSVPFFARKQYSEFDFGYAITVHKSQGSQWDRVTLFDDGFGRDPDTRNRWLYTAITRAAERITIVR